MNHCKTDLQTEKCYHYNPSFSSKNMDYFKPEFSTRFIEHCSELSFDHLKSDLYWERYIQKPLNDNMMSQNMTNHIDRRSNSLSNDKRYKPY